MSSGSLSEGVRKSANAPSPTVLASERLIGLEFTPLRALGSNKLQKKQQRGYENGHFDERDADIIT